jgi:hypothetical protein
MVNSKGVSQVDVLDVTVLTEVDAPQVEIVVAEIPEDRSTSSWQNTKRSVAVL